MSEKMTTPIVRVLEEADPLISLEVEFDSQYFIQWSDGEVTIGNFQEEGVQKAEESHRYSRNGSYRIRVYSSNMVEYYAEHLFRVSSIGETIRGFYLDHQIGENGTVNFTIEDAMFPVDVNFGDGNETRVFDNDFSHQFSDPGEYQIKMRDNSGKRVVLDIQISDEEEDAGQAFVVTHDMLVGLNTHAAINAFVEENDITVPQEWFQLTIAAKKEQLLGTDV